MKYEKEAASDAEIPGAENTWISVYELDMSDPVIAEMMKKIKAAGDDYLQKSIEYAKTGYGMVLKEQEVHQEIYVLLFQTYMQVVYLFHGQQPTKAIPDVKNNQISDEQLEKVSGGGDDEHIV